jgi:hypothetical protein
MVELFLIALGSAAVILGSIRSFVFGCGKAEEEMKTESQ